jgi:hypothetical protein
VSEAVLGEGQEIKDEVEDATSNKLNRPKPLMIAGILITELTPVSFRLEFKTLRRPDFFHKTVYGLIPSRTDHMSD